MKRLMMHQRKFNPVTKNFYRGGTTNLCSYASLLYLLKVKGTDSKGSSSSSKQTCLDGYAKSLMYYLNFLTVNAIVLV